MMHIRVCDLLSATRGRLCSGDTNCLLTDVSTDSRNMHAECLFIPLRGERHDGHDFIRDAFAGGARAALMESSHPGAEKLVRCFPDRALIAVDDTLQALGDLACFWRGRLPATVIAITGSNGKTTTKEMAWCILRDSFSTAKSPGNWNNLIGLPLALLKVREQDTAVLLELGMSARGEIRRLGAICRPDIGLITSVGPAHLEQLSTLDEVQAAKAELLEALGPDNTLILNHDDPRVAALAGRSTSRVLTFGLSGGEVRGDNLRTGPAGGAAFDLHMAGRSVPVQLAVPGAHSVVNALAAAAIACLLHVPPDAVRRGLEAFTGVAGRMEVLHAGPITIINDAYNANPSSMQASLETLASMGPYARRMAALGDMLELGPDAPLFHEQAGKAAAQLGIGRLFVTGAFAAHVKSGAVAAGMPAGAVCVCDSVGQLAGAVRDQAADGDIILVKGSRKMKMETVIAVLQQHYGAPPGGTA